MQCAVWYVSCRMRIDPYAGKMNPLYFQVVCPQNGGSTTVFVHSSNNRRLAEDWIAVARNQD